MIFSSVTDHGVLLESTSKINRVIIVAAPISIIIVLGPTPWVETERQSNG